MSEEYTSRGTHTFTFLGTGAGCGVPAFFCQCPACEEARKTPRAQRGDCGVLIEGTKRLLIDTPPDLRHQLNREHIPFVDAVLYTHAHFDHVGGLGELEYMVRLVTKEKLPIYASAEAIAGIRREFGYLEDCLSFTEVTPFEPFTYDDLRITAIPVVHAPGTFGFLIESAHTRLFYACDTGKLPEKTIAMLQGIDILALDATYWKENWTPHSHHSIQEAIETSAAIQATKTYLTHLSMHYSEPITLVQLEAYLEQYEGRIEPALDGLNFSL